MCKFSTFVSVVMMLFRLWNQQIPLVDVSAVCEDCVILMIIPFTGNILQRISSAFLKKSSSFCPDVFADPISSAQLTLTRH